MAAQVMYLASYTGQKAQKLLDTLHFDIDTDLSTSSSFIRDNETGEFKRDEYGNYQQTRGNYMHIRAGEKDHFGNITNHARSLIYLYKGHDISTMIHSQSLNIFLYLT